MSRILWLCVRPPSVRSPGELPLFVSCAVAGCWCVHLIDSVVLVLCTDATSREVYLSPGKSVRGITKGVGNKFEIIHPVALN